MFKNNFKNKLEKRRNMEKLINKIVGKRKIPANVLCFDIPSKLNFENLRVTKWQN